ncbi:MAG TPA: iron-sulfur cluster assembly scaffold protein [Anaeromyxobacter sp.]|nr:iron-sulfur cluster assembly scaffold protein [Anaeromyxobacter sp.]
MSAEDLYHEALVRLARAARGAGRLEGAAGAATLDNPLCGDRASFQVRLAGDRIEALAHQVRGCVLCEASASFLGGAAPGWTGAEVEAARGALEALLAGGGPAVVGPFGGLSVFAPVRAAPSRHGCVLLPFDALRAALAEAKG